MKLISKLLTAIAAGIGSIVGALVLIAVVVALVTQSIPTGLKASLTLTHYAVVMTGGILSYADNVGPDLQAGKTAGDKALPTPKTAKP